MPATQRTIRFAMQGFDHAWTTFKVAAPLGVVAIAAGLIIYSVWGDQTNGWRLLATAWFEEPLKIAASLLIFILAGLRRPGKARNLYLATLVTGISFAIFEHYTSYPEEAVETYLLRIASHPGYLVLGLAVANRSGSQVGAVLWTIVAGSMHTAQNFVVVITSIAQWSDEAQIAAKFFMVAVMYLILGFVILIRRRTANSIRH